MPFYVGDYLRDTQHLTTQQHGAYLLLMLSMWSAGGYLPKDPKKLARIAGLSARVWKSSSPELMAFFTEVDGEKITNTRLLTALQKATKNSSVRVTSGRQGGLAKALNDKETSLAKAIAKAWQNPSMSEPDKNLERVLPPTPPYPPTPPTAGVGENLGVDSGGGHMAVATQALDTFALEGEIRAMLNDYPRRAGGQGSRQQAGATIRHNISSGIVDLAGYQAALSKYTKAMQAMGKIGSQYIQKIDNWFDTGWKEEYQAVTSEADDVLERMKRR